MWRLEGVPVPPATVKRSSSGRRRIRRKEDDEGKGFKEEEGKGKEEEGKGWVNDRPFWWRKRCIPAAHDPEHSEWRGIGFKEGWNEALSLVGEHLTQEALDCYHDTVKGPNYAAMLRRMAALRRRTC